MGATAVNLAEVDATEAIMDATGGFGVDCGVEPVGFQAHDPAAFAQTGSSSWSASVSAGRRGPSSAVGRAPALLKE
jgi:threonine dehydrogenase-like Zn-dependent dehydrogenase